jgi:hypothetical protein
MHGANRIYVDTHSLRPIGAREYLIMQRNDYTFAQPTDEGKRYTTSLTLERIRCDTRAMTATKVALLDDTGQIAYDSGEPPTNRAPKQVEANSVGEAVVNAACD